MNRSIVLRLIAKDLCGYSGMIVCALVAGIASLTISHFSRQPGVASGADVGLILFITTIVAYGIFVSMFGILKERQDRSQMFILSLPISPAQYSIAKVISALMAFLIPWSLLTLGVVVLSLIMGRPAGGLPFFIAIMVFFLGNFCILLAVVVITMSEYAAIAGILITNISVSIFMVNISQLLGVAGRETEAVAVWSPAILVVLGIELVVIFVSLFLSFYVPWRRKDLI